MSGEAVTRLLMAALTRHPIAPPLVGTLSDPTLALRARTEVALLRLDEALQRVGLEPPPALARAIANERTRVRAMKDVIERLADVCERRGIPAVFPKAFQHWPDMGHDIDLLVADGTREVDAVLLSELEAVPSERGVFDPLAGKTSFQIRGGPGPVEVHHARLGRVGDLPAFACDVVGRAVSAHVTDSRARVPTDEDSLLIQVIQRVYDHRSIRLSDAVRTMHLLDAGVDAAAVVGRASANGLRAGLDAYLRSVRAIVRDVLDSRPAAQTLSAFGIEETGPVALPARDGGWRIPLRAVIALYLVRIAARLSAGDAEAVVRLSLTVPLAGAATIRRYLPRAGSRRRPAA